MFVAVIKAPASSLVSSRSTFPVMDLIDTAREILSTVDSVAGTIVTSLSLDDT